MITVQILVRNDEKTIERALNSVRGIGASVLVGDLGSTDGTLKRCRSMGAEIVRVDWRDDYSSVRNGLSRKGMNFYLNPWEYLAEGGDLLSSCVSDAEVYVIQNGMVSKELRIWSDKSRFTNPVYETVENSESSICHGVVVLSDGGPDLREEKSAICKKWMKEKPTHPDPYYYMAISCLAERKYDEFYLHARQYLEMDKKAQASAIMLRYYMAHIEMHKGKLKSALENLSSCICYLPEFSEFWCLMGDIFYKAQDYNKARCMYENAIMIGKRRSNNDHYPIEIEKYGKYPQKMIENIGLISRSSKIVQSVE